MKVPLVSEFGLELASARLDVLPPVLGCDKNEEYKLKCYSAVRLVSVAHTHLQPLFLLIVV